MPEEVRAEWSKWGYAKDKFTDNNNFPRRMYVRGARRMIRNDVIITTRWHDYDLPAVPVEDPILVNFWPQVSYVCWAGGRQGRLIRIRTSTPSVELSKTAPSTTMVSSGPRVRHGSHSWCRTRPSCPTPPNAATSSRQCRHLAPTLAMVSFARSTLLRLWDRSTRLPCPSQSHRGFLARKMCLMIF